MKVLGIETSCDETGVALYDGDSGLIGHAVYSQVALHEKFGGVVPELASRDHVRKLAPMIAQLLEAHAVAPASIDGVAYTAGPGLAGALLVGAGFARSLAWAWGYPPWVCIIWKAIYWRPCLKTRCRISRSWRCWSQAAIPSSSR